MKTQRQDSRQEWSGNSTIESINTGSLQRIADATEKMASNYLKMETDLAAYKRWYAEKTETIEKLHRRISALKGVITKLKNN